jgi:hemoglobin-like flavoprotein
MDQAQRTLVRATFARIAPISDQAAAKLYENIFAIDPDLRRLFKVDIETQGKKIMAMIKTAIDSLDRLDEILPRVRELGRRHVGYGVEDRDYDTVGVALMKTLASALGDEFTPAARDAWAVCYQELTGEMKAGAAAEDERDAA